MQDLRQEEVCDHNKVTLWHLMCCSGGKWPKLSFPKSEKFYKENRVYCSLCFEEIGLKLLNEI